MAEIDYEPVEATEEERKRREDEYPPVSVRPPYGPPAPPASPERGIPAPSPQVPLNAGALRDVAAVAPVAPQVRARPQWSDYAPAEPHGWSKFGHFAASLSPLTDRFFNKMPEQRAEQNYKAATTEYEAPIKDAQEQATTEHTKAETEALKHPQPKQGVTPEESTIHDLMTGENGGPRQNPQTQKPYSYLEAYEAVKKAGAEAKPPKEANDKDKDIKDYLEAHGLPDTADNREKARGAIAERGKQEPGAYMPLYDDKGHVMGAWNPKTGHVNRTPEGGLPGTTSQGLTADRRAIAEHDKAYVQPAEGVEKSYQMMDNAYNDYKTAKAQGKELPTGAESMLALSTHLSTTFGNVKGARVTKDMIEHHLGARGISDSAVVAIQKLTNGDVLSPDQWEAFHKLIKESRDLSWKTAQKEAERKHIPVDFLPNDLKNSAAGRDLGPAPEGSKEGRTGTAPDGSKVVVKNGRLVSQ